MMYFRRGRSTWTRWFGSVVFFVLVGFVFHEQYSLFQLQISSTDCSHSLHLGRRSEKSGIGVWHGTSALGASNIYVGMMSAGKFITNRVQRAIDTWLQKGRWKVEVFADGDPSSLFVPPGLDFGIVTLPSVDDKAYPPQKKCFMMMRYMYDNHINDYEWFMRVDDDAYLDYSRLTQLLNTINSSLPIFFGSPGFGIDPDDGMEQGMYYLMGGPGMIFSRGLLRLLRSQLSYCVRHMFSPHEDIEIGRCVWKYVKDVVIPKAWETKELFYQQYDKVTGDVVNIVLDDLTPSVTAKTVSYHAVKKQELLYQLHSIVLHRKIKARIEKTAFYKREMKRMEAVMQTQEASDLSPKSPWSQLPVLLGLNDKMSKFGSSSWPAGVAWRPPSPVLQRYTSQIAWINWDKYYRHLAESAVPMRGHSSREQAALLRWIADVKERFVRETCPELGKDPQFVNGYLKTPVGDGVYLSMTYRGYDSGGAKHCNVLVEANYGVTLFNEVGANLSQALLNAACSTSVNQLEKKQSPPSLQCSIQDRVVMIIPLSGRYKAMKRFLERYERDFFKPLDRTGLLPGFTSRFSVQLVIVLLSGEGDELGLSDAAANLLRSYQRAYGSHLLRYHIADTEGRAFSRGAGIQLGSLATSPNDVIFFMDIDMIVTPTLVGQCRRIAEQGQTAWYPISFSQYDPDRLCFDGGLARAEDERPVLYMVNPNGEEAPDRSSIRDRVEETPLTLSEERGFWRDFGYGIACMYKSDFVHAGGFDLSIEGWGEEDIRMYLSLLKSGLDVYRSKQVDLIHIHHTKHCDSSLTGEQALSCFRTKASHYASQRCLARTYYNRRKKSS